MKNISFEILNQKGKIGEFAIMNYYRNLGYTVQGVSEKQEYQVQDIDMIINDITVEVKTQSCIYQRNTICLEIVENMSENYKEYRQGWFQTTKATAILFYSPEQNAFYKMPMNGLRYLLNTLPEDKIQYQTPTVKDGAKVKKQKLAFLSIDDLLEIKLCQKIYIGGQSNEN